jgi:uncharacterized 2Fe-2S/4Fe-4S cluster protein (DUF4445 family)
MGKKGKGKIMAKIIIITSNEQYQVEIPVGSRILGAMDQLGLFIEAPCNGSGTCGKCKVQIIEEQTQETSWVLACQKQVTCNTVVKIPQGPDNDQKQIVQSDQKIETYLVREWQNKRNQFG